MSGYLRTFTGKAFYPKDPRVEDIDIEDIAHALSMQCRWGGHPNRFYSVAEHSVHVSRHCPLELRLWGLLHDSTEAYLVDVPRPIKQMLPDYVALENSLMQVIIKRFDLVPAAHMPPAVKAIDNRILLDERGQLFTNQSSYDVDIGSEPLGIEMRCWEPRVAEGIFLDRFRELTEKAV